MICSPWFVVYGWELAGDWRRQHDGELHDLHFRHCGLRKGAKRGMEKNAKYGDS
jgi:hypothetical protein